jgi:3-dehydroquinate synthase
MIRVKVTLPERSYDASIENGLIERIGAQLRGLLEEKRPLFVVTVAPVRRRWSKKLTDSLAAAGFDSHIVEMPNGERNKRLSTVELLAEKLLRLEADRRAVVLAFGGGVVGDVGGMLASVYMRGVDLVQIPTTVQAQVDASVGGKTGVNLRSGKNLVGTFYQPRTVLIDPALLSTLPQREFQAGLYESLKCGVIGSPELFFVMERHRARELRHDAKSLEWIIAESVRLKAEVVSADEREGGLRRVLNFGHTIGHALETATGYKHFLHGEAVAWGMIAASKIARAVGRLDKVSETRIRDAVLGFGLLPPVSARTESVLKLLKNDKKTSAGVVHFVLPKEIGKVEIVNDVPTKVIAEAIDELRTMSK